MAEENILIEIDNKENKENENKENTKITEDKPEYENKTVQRNIKAVSLKKLTKMVIEEVREINRRRQEEEKKKPQKTPWFDYFINFVLVIGAIGTIAYLIYIVWYTRKQTAGQGNQRNPYQQHLQDMYKVRDDYERIDAEKFKDTFYYGHTDTLKQMIHKLELGERLREKLGKNVKNYIKNTSRNFLFTGEPGTGKTYFVKKFSYELSKKLKLKILMKSENKKADQVSMMADFETKLKNIPCQVEVAFVDAGSILSKFVGDAEHRLKSLFSWARDSSNSRYKIVFVDEIDTFISGDRNNTAEHTLSLKNQMLTLLDGGNYDSIDSKLIFIGSTNRLKDIKQDYLRRFDVIYNFKAPGKVEAKDFIIRKLQFLDACYQYADEEYEVFARKCTNMSQNNITKIFNDVFCLAIDSGKRVTSDIVIILIDYFIYDNKNGDRYQDYYTSLFDYNFD